MPAEIIRVARKTKKREIREKYITKQNIHVMGKQQLFHTLLMYYYKHIN